ncbi:hypothetical protein N800_02245 [Lysobacter daejeonensis GH1-9]|uniref:Uncharacterized protein n=1 Tax=Lysobacter daejeonensis GH1-9 TaxID=1385517 RepID=A0A0A0EVH4_9GAMM|nr:hypothetical protein N800_02245 [Lysobacter daejeonensis GH1-9]
MTPSRLGTQIFGLCLLLLGGWLCYNSLSAIAYYFQTGTISYGRPPRRVDGELALLFHSGWILMGAWGTSKGVILVATGREPRA